MNRIKIQVQGSKKTDKICTQAGLKWWNETLIIFTSKQISRNQGENLKWKYMTAVKKSLRLLEEEKFLRKWGNTLFYMTKVIKVVWKKTLSVSLRKGITNL